MDKYTKISIIGKGTFGAVYLVRNEQNKKLYALKQIQLDERNKHRTKESVLREAKILSQLKHPNVVAYCDSFFDDDQEHLFIVQDYCDGGTLDDKIQSAEQVHHYFEEKQVMQWFIQIAMAVQYIHAQKILHRDLKTQNVFMKKRGDTCKVGDFGIAKKMSATLDQASTFVGTPFYLAPEMCQDIPYSSKADVWALGCILYEMCSLKPPFDGSNLVSVIYKIVKGTPDHIPSHYSSSLSDLVNHILTKDPDIRPSACQLLKLSFVKSALDNFVDNASSKARKADSNLNSSPQSDSSPDCNPLDDPLSATLTQLNVHDFSAVAKPRRNVKDKGAGVPSELKPYQGYSKNHPLPPITTSKNGSLVRDAAHKNKDRSIEGNEDSSAAAAGLVEYEDDFEAYDEEQNSIVSEDDDVPAAGAARDHDSSFETDYCDDFEEYSPEQELEDIKNCAKEVQQNVWNSVDDVTIMDVDGPIDIRHLLKPHCEAIVGRDRFSAILTNSSPSVAQKRGDAYAIRSKGSSEMCHFIEELYGGPDNGDDS